MASSNSATLANVPRRMRLPVISAKKRSTRFSHDDEVGMKCTRKRGCFFSHANFGATNRFRSTPACERATSRIGGERSGRANVSIHARV